MRTVGIIAEYNPFHTGHEYHIQKARELSGADYAVIVMSPDFVQRGEPAIFDKYTRTRMALLGGADLVIELPVCYAAGSAEYFAEGAVSMLNALSVTDVLCFGGESADFSLFQKTAEILHQEPEIYIHQLRQNLKQGLTYPQARSAALKNCCTKKTDTVHETAFLPEDAKSLESFLAYPNNILGIEYCKALQKTRSPIHALPVRRIGSAYNSTALSGSYCSAAALRSAIVSGTDPASLTGHIPGQCTELFCTASRTPLYWSDFLPFLTAKLLSVSSYDSILDISSDLSDRIQRLRYQLIGKSYQTIVASLKTRQLTEARIRRALLHLVLNIEAASVDHFRRNGTVFYARILGFRKSASPLLHLLKQQSQIPLVAKASSFEKNVDSPAKEMWNQDVCASHLYRSVLAARYALPFKSEYECSPIIL